MVNTHRLTWSETDPNTGVVTTNQKPTNSQTFQMQVNNLRKNRNVGQIRCVKL